MPGPAEGARARLDRVRRMVRIAPRAIETAARLTEGESVRLRAMALTFISLFALVPGLVVAFSVVQAFTGMQRISDRVHEYVLDNLAVGARASLEPYLDRFIHNAHTTGAGLVGGALLVWSAVLLFSNVEGAVNDIWGIKRRRPLSQRAVIYWVGLTLGPLLLAGSVTLAHAARAWLGGTSVLALAATGGGLLTCGSFAILYQIIPWTRVRVLAASAAGLVAGAAWELAKWGYTFIVERFVHYHAIYGSMAAIPVFMLWLYVSWTILLFGARLAFVLQYAPVILSGAPYSASKAGREVLAGQAMLEVAVAFDAGGEAPEASDVATRIHATAEEVGEALLALRTSGLIVMLADGGLVPSKPLERISLLDVRQAVVGAPPVLETGSPIGEIVKGVDDLAGERLSAVTYRMLCDRVRGEGQPAGAIDQAVAVPAASPVRSV